MLIRFNHNMRCIEMQVAGKTIEERLTFNHNMRCIEIE